MNDERLRELIAESPEPSPDVTWMNTLEQRVRAAVVAGGRRRVTRFNRWLTTGLVAAACIALVLLTLVPGVIPGGASAGTSFAAVQQQMQGARRVSVRSRLELELNGRLMPLSQARSWLDQDLGACSEIDLLGQPLVQVWLPWRGQPMLIDHLHRVTMPIELPGAIDASELQRLDPTALVRQLAGYPGRVEPMPLAAGDAELGFSVSGAALHLPESVRVEVMVDRATQLPTRVACRVPLQTGRTLVWTADGFDWNTPAETASPPSPPENYKSIRALVVPKPGEAPLLRTLEDYALLEDGSFPGEEMPAWAALGRILVTVTQPAADPDPLRPGRDTRQALGDAIAGSLFLLHLQDAGAEFQYAGGDVRLGDQAVLLRWRLKDGRERVVRGNLQTESIQP